ncbi:hypothetical protein LX59_01183 [Azomonas agilis]|uniref:Uncharacterized protein n=1 Tax=Azomonas agilis TaxID=116849 RepID=A0A562IYY4_9GAMM|nr:hypothetical protein [Azomonas agilis]TWH76261.1 hypothetical protein LX59_01183 [Azomonas agilis]
MHSDNFRGAVLEPDINDLEGMLSRYKFWVKHPPNIMPSDIRAFAEDQKRRRNIRGDIFDPKVIKALSKGVIRDKGRVPEKYSDPDRGMTVFLLWYHYHLDEEFNKKSKQINEPQYDNRAKEVADSIRSKYKKLKQHQPDLQFKVPNARQAHDLIKDFESNGFCSIPDGCTDAARRDIDEENFNAAKVYALYVLDGLGKTHDEIEQMKLDKAVEILNFWYGQKSPD